MKFKPDTKYLVLANPQIALQRAHPPFQFGEVVRFKEKIDNIKEDIFVFLFEAIERPETPLVWMELDLEEIEPDWSRFFLEIKTSEPK